jgi:hypothetical protein
MDEKTGIAPSYLALGIDGITPDHNAHCRASAIEDLGTETFG